MFDNCGTQFHSRGTTKPLDKIYVMKFMTFTAAFPRHPTPTETVSLCLGKVEAATLRQLL
jgi:hypothetical protein